MTCDLDVEGRGRRWFCEGYDWIWVIDSLKFLGSEILCWVYEDV